MRCWTPLLLVLGSEACSLSEDCTREVAETIATSSLPCEERWSTAQCGAQNVSEIDGCWEEIRTTAVAMGFGTLCVPEVASEAGQAALPVCGRLPVIPTWGTVVETTGTIWDGSKKVDAWDFQLHNTACRIGLRETWHINHCLTGSWLVLLGASQSSVWLQQLANTLVPGAFNAVRDGFITDGVYLQLMDLIIEDGQIVHKTIVYTGDKKHPNQHKGAHSLARDGSELPFVFAKLALAPAFNGKQIRITNLLAEYWDEARMGLLAVEGLKEGGWNESKVFPVVAVGLWYAYSKGCHLSWCETRPHLAGLHTDSIIEAFLEGMRRTAATLQSFCSPNGRAGVHGCTVMSVEYCSEYYKNPIYNHLHEAMRSHFEEFTSMSVRYFDVWSFTEQVPEDCIWGHMSPASAAFLIQMLLSSVCDVSLVAKGKLLSFVGEACRSEQITPYCSGMHCKGFSYTWDYALSKNCKLLAAEGQLSEPSKGGPWVDKWMLKADEKAMELTTTTTAPHILNRSVDLLHAVAQEMAEAAKAREKGEAAKARGRYDIFGSPEPTKLRKPSGLGGQGKHFSFGKVFRFMSFKSLIESLPEDEGKELARWVLVLLWLLVAVLLARYSWWLMQVCGLAQLLEWLLPSKKEQVWPGEMLRRMQSQSKMGVLIQSSQSQTEESSGSVSTHDGGEASDHALLPHAESTKEVPLEPRGERFAFGAARYAASLHVVLGHLNARGLAQPWYLCCWGYTWVPWFFMLSGFILCAAELSNPRAEVSWHYVARRLVTIYPVYGFGRLLAALLTSQGPPDWVLLLQAWLLQAWIPSITEWGLQMQCWFLSCLVVYWAAFPHFFAIIRTMSLRQVVFGMVLAVCVPVLYLLVPDLFYGKADWYEYHSWGQMRNFEDALVVMLKFHPICYLHVFLLGMLLAQLRALLPSALNLKDLPVSMDLLAPLGYLGLLLVFTVPQASPLSAKLSARIFVLLPLQGAVVLGLAGLPGFRVPKLAAWLSGLNFLESYSYCLYVMQFICMKLWFGEDYDVTFFIFLISIATFVQVLVQRPAERLSKIAPGTAAWTVPSAMTLLLVLIGMWRWRGSLDHVLPARIQGEGYLDVEMPLKLNAQDWARTGGGAFINPSLTLLEDGRLVVAARLHRREVRFSHFSGGTLMEEIWVSSILLGGMPLNNETWPALMKGEIPSLVLRPWDGLQLMSSEPWIYPNLCSREKWLPENRTMIRFVVTGPEDPKVFPLTRRGCAKSTDCFELRDASDPCSASQSSCQGCGARWCSKGEVQLAFSSYTPKESGVSCKHRDVVQMYLASGVDDRRPQMVSDGQHLQCGQYDHNEKNWIPFQVNGKTFVVYSLLPHLVRELDTSGRCGQQWRSIFPKLERMQSHWLDAAIRGSASAVYVHAPNATRRLPKPHFLALFHAADLEVRRYAHYAYRFSVEPPFEILQVSEPLPLQRLPPAPGSPPFAFASGLLVKEEQVVLTYAAGDREPRALLMSLRQLDSYFH